MIIYKKRSLTIREKKLKRKKLKEKQRFISKGLSFLKESNAINTSNQMKANNLTEKRQKEIIQQSLNDQKKYIDKIEARRQKANRIKVQNFIMGKQPDVEEIVKGKLSNEHREKMAAIQLQNMRNKYVDKYGK